MDCSCGWSVAEPVDRSLPWFWSSPGGAKEFRCQARTRNFSFISSPRPRAVLPGFRRQSPSASIPTSAVLSERKKAFYEIGGVEDHVHLYLRWRPDGRVSDLMRTVKAGSSKWMHETFPELAAFAWQEGYSAFSVSKSQEDALKRYIKGQAEHHKTEDFKSELLRTLRVHGVEVDEKYAFD